MNSATSPRVARRRAETRARLLSVAARRFAERGLDAVRLDEIADEADVARGTLYSHFDTKEALAIAVLRPVLQKAVDTIRSQEHFTAQAGVEGLLELYLLLWREHRDALRVAYRLQEMPLGELAPLHRDFMIGALAVLNRASEAHLLRVSNGALAARTLSRVAIPLLELYAEQPDPDRLFMESMRGLLLADNPPAR